VFARAVADGKLTADPTDGLRLPKGRASSWLPYSDGEAARILTAARVETRPSLRWAPWIMAFTGMRVAEVLQLTGGDVREEAGIHYVSVNEDEPGKSVKNSERRNVPLHSALLAEGFLTYAQTIAPTAPLFRTRHSTAMANAGGVAGTLWASGSASLSASTTSGRRRTTLGGTASKTSFASSSARRMSGMRS
jgi:integrase